MPKRKTPSGGFKSYKTPYKKRRTMGQPRRTFVPRTMGPFSQSESKYFESYKAATAISEAVTWAGSELDPVTSSGSQDTLFAPTIGTTAYSRVGRKVSLYKISMRGLISTTVLQDQADIVSSPAVRVIIYIDKQTNGLQAQGEDVMALWQPSTAGTDTIESAFCSFQNPANFGRFQVLRDIIYRPRIVTSGTDGTGTTSQNVSQIPFKITIKFKKPLVIKFNEAQNISGSVADIVDNSLHIIALKSGTAFASTLSYICRGYFKDL